MERDDSSYCCAGMRVRKGRRAREEGRACGRPGLRAAASSVRESYVGRPTGSRQTGSSARSVAVHPPTRTRPGGSVTAANCTLARTTSLHPRFCLSFLQPVLRPRDTQHIGGAKWPEWQCADNGRQRSGLSRHVGAAQGECQGGASLGEVRVEDGRPQRRVGGRRKMGRVQRYDHRRRNSRSCGALLLTAGVCAG